MGAAGRAPLSPMGRQPSFTSPAPPPHQHGRHAAVRAWIVNSENVDPNADEASSRASSRASPATAYTSPSTLANSVGSAADLEQRRRPQPLGRRSISGASSTSSGSKRRCDDALEARGEKRRCMEIEERLAQSEERLAEEIKRRETLERMLAASEKRAQRFMIKYHHRFRSMTMWRLRAHRAKSALRAFWVTGKDGNTTRARPVLVQKGGKRRAIQRQVTVESGSLQPRQGGVGGTEYTTRERLLAWKQDVVRGISSRWDAGGRNNADRVCRQLEAAAIMLIHAPTQWAQHSAPQFRRGSRLVCPALGADHERNPPGSSPPGGL